MGGEEIDREGGCIASLILRHGTLVNVRRTMGEGHKVLREFLCG